MKFFCVKEFFFVNFDFQNECKNEFEDNNEKVHPDSLGVKRFLTTLFTCLEQLYQIRTTKSGYNFCLLYLY